MCDLIIVDDDPIILDLLKAVLQSKGDWDVRYFNTSQGALEAWPKRGAAVLLTDIRMPVMSGFSLSAEVARIDPGCERFAMTGQTISGQEKELFSQVFGKPFGVYALMDTLAEAVGSRRRVASL